MAMDSTAPAPPDRAPRRSQLAAARAGPQARPRSFSQSTEFIMSFSAPGPRPADAPGRCSLDLGFKIKNGIQNFQQHVAARFRENPSASCTFPSQHGVVMPSRSKDIRLGSASVVLSQSAIRNGRWIVVSKCFRCASRSSSLGLPVVNLRMIYDYITTPRRTRSQAYKGAGAPQRDDGGAARTHARARPAPQEKEPPQQSPRRARARAPRDATVRACLEHSSHLSHS